MDHLNDVARSRLLEYLESGEWLLPCGLSAEVLDEITKEVNCLDVDLQSNADLEKSLPALAHFLRGYRSYSVESSATLSKKLDAVVNRLEEMAEQGIRFRVKGDNLLELIMQMRTEEERREQEREDSQEDTELDLHIAKRQAELRAKMKVKPKPVIQESDPPVEPFPGMEKVRSQLRLFTDLQESMSSAIGAFPQFESSKKLRLQVLALPNAESDVLLRYQTNWERRLSAAIGEFLELRKRNGH